MVATHAHSQNYAWHDNTSHTHTHTHTHTRTHARTHTCTCHTHAHAVECTENGTSMSECCGSVTCIQVGQTSSQHKHTKSYTEHIHGSLPCWITIWSRWSFISALSTILSSTVFSVINRKTCTCFIWPIRWARSWQRKRGGNGWHKQRSAQSIIWTQHVIVVTRVEWCIWFVLRLSRQWDSFRSTNSIMVSILQMSNVAPDC